MIQVADSKLVDNLVPATNFEPRRGNIRPDILLLHYTGMVSCARAIDWLVRPESRVSCHYAIDVDGEITQMVPESLRAWHAGIGIWAGASDINSRSIGIEIHNPGHDLGYPAFPERQMLAVEALSRDIIQRWSLAPQRILAHSDIAPERKSDPGEGFDWARLARAGVGHWVAPSPLSESDIGEELGSTAGSVSEMQALLRRYGYEVPTTGVLDRQTAIVVAGFQRHFRQARVDGRIDQSTLDTLRRLIEALPVADGGIQIV